MKKYILGILIILIMFFGSIFLIHSHGNKTTESTYDLQEIENGKYVIYQSTVSSIPAYNYDVATVCINGGIVQLKGNVEIMITDTESPYVIITKTKWKGTRIKVFVLKGQVEYGGIVTVR